MRAIERLELTDEMANNIIGENNIAKLKKELINQFDKVFLIKRVC